MARRFRKIGLLGKLGIRKVNVPSLSGLTRAQAKQELESKGLTWQETAESTANISLDLNIKEQSVAAGSVVKIGDTIGFTYYGYVAPPNFNPGFNPGFVAPPDPPQIPEIGDIIFDPASGNYGVVNSVDEDNDSIDYDPIPKDKVPVYLRKKFEEENL